MELELRLYYAEFEPTAQGPVVPQAHPGSGSFSDSHGNIKGALFEIELLFEMSFQRWSATWPERGWSRSSQVVACALTTDAHPGCAWSARRKGRPGRRSAVRYAAP